MSKKHPPSTHASSEKSLHTRNLWLLRAAGAFILLAGVITILYWVGYNAYAEVAEWATPGSHEALIYEGETYYFSGQIGKKGLTKAKYPIDELLGQVKDDGVPVTTEPVTTSAPETEEAPPEETDTDEETEVIETLPESVIPPMGADLFTEGDHAYVLYSVKDKPEFLIVFEKDGEMYLYYREDVENPVRK